MNALPDFEYPEDFDPIEELWIAYRETLAAHRCLFLLGIGTCVTGCRTEPSCWTDCPDAEGWGPEIRRLELLIARDLEAAEPAHLAGGCCVRRLSGHPYHPYAPQGLSFCHGCRRVVIRDKGRWWE